VRLADHRAGPHAEDLHDLVPVQIRADLLQFLPLRQERDALLQVVVGAGQPGGLLPVAGRAVGPGERVQPGEQRPGVADITPHRRVGPAALVVPVEPQVEGDQRGHVVHHAGGEAQLAEPGPGHRGAHHLVMVERHPPVRQQAAGLRLADVVQQRGQPEPQVGFQPVSGLQGDGLLQHGQRVLVDVLVPEMLIGLEPEPGNLGQYLIGHPGVHQQGDSSHRAAARCEHELGEFVPDPFGRHYRQPGGESRHRLAHVGRHREIELCGEPGGAQYPQRVVGERILRPARRAQHLVPQVGQPPEWVGQFQRGQPGGHRVDGEVAPRQVVVQRSPVVHLGLARVMAVALAAVGGDLADGAALAQPHGAEVDPDLPYRVRPALGELEHLPGPGVRGQVEVTVAAPEEDVPDGAADQGELVAVAGEQPREAGHGRRDFAQQGRRRPALFRGQVVGIWHGHRG